MSRHAPDATSVLDLPDADLPNAQRRAALDAALREIDNRWGGARHRRFLRAVAAYNHGDAMVWHREMQAGVAEAADDLGLPRGDILRYVQTASQRLTMPRPRRN